MWDYESYKSFRRKQDMTAATWFREKGYPVMPKYPFILNSMEDWRSNIILSEVADYIAAMKLQYENESKPFPLHKFIHHGLSSQAGNAF